MLQEICDIALSINIAKSQDNQSSDLFSDHQDKTKIIDGYKCFKCYGYGYQNCSECSGTQIISKLNPMARLLNSILLRKLNIKRKQSQRQESQFERVQPIKEEEQDNDEKRLICSFCSFQCDSSNYYCPECPKFTICQTCEKKNINHQHQIFQHCKIQNSNICKTSLFNNSSSDSPKICFSCNNSIENCYMVCTTCKKSNKQYWICGECSDSKRYFHSSTHILETVIDYQSFKDNQIQTISQQFDDDNVQSMEQFVQKPKEEDQLYSDFLLNKKNSSIANYIDHSGDQSPLLQCNKSLQIVVKNTAHVSNVSRVKFQLDGLFSSYQFSFQSKNNILCPPKVGSHYDKSSNRQSLSNISNQKQNCDCEPFTQYVFLGYKCDVCNIEPIKNIRYHCTTCSDFDVCQKCYDTDLNVHQHITFDRLDHQQLKQRALQKVFHNKDTNLNNSGNLIRRINRSKTLRLNSDGV